MIVSVTFEADDVLRRAIRALTGETGLASAREVRDYFRENGTSCNDDLIHGLDIAELDKE